ncbi:MAG: redoxin domain-containing protein [Flavobacteriales bacterium]
MKKTIAFAALILGIGFSSCDSKDAKPTGTNVTVEIEGLDTVIVSEIHPQEAVAVDTVLFTNGKANIKLDVEAAGFYSLVFNDKTSSTLFIDKLDQIVIKLDTVNPDQMYDIEGSQASQDVEELFSYQNRYSKSLNRLAVQAQGASQGKIDTLLQYKSLLDSEFKAKIGQFIETKTSSPAALLALFQGTGQQLIFDLYRDYAIYQEVHDSVEAKYPDFKDHLAFIKQNLDRTIAKDFNLPTADGKQVQLSDYAGKWLVINIWASWEQGSRDLNKIIAQVAKDFPETKFVSIALDGKEDQKNPKTDWQNAIKEDKLTSSNWTHLSDLLGTKSSIISLYEFNSIPQLFIINPEGRIVARNLMESDLRNLLNQNKK